MSTLWYDGHASKRRHETGRLALLELGLVEHVVPIGTATSQLE
jgi:hypothetical protein